MARADFSAAEWKSVLSGSRDIESIPTAIFPDGAESKQFTSESFHRIQRASSFIGAVAFWRMLENLDRPKESTRRHAKELLGQLAKRGFEDCHGWAISPQHKECLMFCGVVPIGVRGPGSMAER
jgi:hypothetical protein